MATEPADIPNDSLGATIRDAMRSRPMPVLFPDLAVRAIAMATRAAPSLAPAQLARLVALRRRVQVIGALAACLVLAVMVVGYRAIPAEFTLFASTSSDATTDTTDVDTMSATDDVSSTASTSTSTTPYGSAGVALFLAACVAVAMELCLSSGSRRLDTRFIPTFR
jgi:hypothetical protein